MRNAIVAVLAINVSLSSFAQTPESVEALGAKNQQTPVYELSDAQKQVIDTAGHTLVPNTEGYVEVPVAVAIFPNKGSESPEKQGIHQEIQALDASAAISNSEIRTLMDTPLDKGLPEQQATLPVDTKNFEQKFGQKVSNLWSKFFDFAKTIGLEARIGIAQISHPPPQIWWEPEGDPKFNYTSPSGYVGIVIPLPWDTSIHVGAKDLTLFHITLDSWAIADDNNYWNCPPHGKLYPCKDRSFWHGSGNISYPLRVAIEKAFHIPFTGHIKFLKDTKFTIAVVYEKVKSSWFEMIPDFKDGWNVKNPYCAKVEHNGKLINGFGLEFGLTHGHWAVRFSVEPTSGTGDPYEPGVGHYSTDLNFAYIFVPFGNK